MFNTYTPTVSWSIGLTINSNIVQWWSMWISFRKFVCQYRAFCVELDERYVTERSLPGDVSRPAAVNDCRNDAAQSTMEWDGVVRCPARSSDAPRSVAVHGPGLPVRKSADGAFRQCRVTVMSARLEKILGDWKC